MATVAFDTSVLLLAIHPGSAPPLAPLTKLPLEHAKQRVDYLIRKLQKNSSVRPTWAHTCGCKSRHELVTVSEVKRNCMRATECGKEAWSVNREPMDKNCIEGAAKQGERASPREALVTKAKWRKCGGCAMKVCVLTWGHLALCQKVGKGKAVEQRGHVCKAIS